MRIRKNSKLSSQYLSEALGVDTVQLEAHVCQLNQSPWDVLSFSSSSSQFGEDNNNTSFLNSAKNGKESLSQDSICAVESLVSLMDGDNMVIKNDIKKQEDQIGLKETNEVLVYCNKTDGKRWHCKRLAKQGHSMCEHHLNQLKSYSNKNNNNAGTSKKKGRSRSTKKGSSSTENPYQFYYYSGFGPKWGKKRLDDTGIGNDIIVDALESESPSSLMKNDTEEIDYVDDDDIYDEETEDSSDKKKKKKMRKPVKARSLKSLL